MVFVEGSLFTDHGRKSIRRLHSEHVVALFWSVSNPARSLVEVDLA